MDKQEGMVHRQIVPCCLWERREGMYLVTDLNELMTIHYTGFPAERKEFASGKGPCNLGAL